MSEFSKFLTTNGIKKGEIASFLGVSPAFVTQLSAGSRNLPSAKLALIKANKAWDTSMLTSERMTGPLDVTGLLRGTKLTSGHVRSAVEKVLHHDEVLVAKYLEVKIKDLETKITEKDSLINQLYEQIGMLKAELNLTKKGND